MTQPTKGEIIQELIHIFNDQLSNHNKAKEKKTMKSQINCLKTHFLKLLSVQTHDTSLITFMLDILNKPMIPNLQLGQRTPFENMIKATNPHPKKRTLVPQKNKQWKNQE